MASTYLKRDLSVSETIYKWTWSAWVKRGTINGSAQNLFKSRQDSNNWVQCYFGDGSSVDKIIVASFKNGGYHYDFTTNRRFRDTNAWYHIIINVDSSQSTAGDRVRIYVNGERETSFSNSTNNLTNGDSLIFNLSDSGTGHTIGSWNAGTYFDGSMSHVHYSSGYSYAPTVFGSTDSTTGEWKINTSPSFTLGGNGYTVLKDGNTITDQSANSNDFTLGGGILTKTESSPSNVFCTWNPLLPHSAGGYTMTYSYGNNNIVFGNAASSTFTPSTIGASTGKYYFESKISNAGSGFNGGAMTLSSINANQTSGGFDDYVGKNTNDVGYQFNGEIVKNGSSLQTGLTSVGVGNILGVAMDLDNNTIQFYVNGSSSGNAVSLSADETYFFAFSGRNSAKAECNFGNGYFADNAVSSAGTNVSGNGIFEYDVPTGFTALSTKGLNL